MARHTPQQGRITFTPRREPLSTDGYDFDAPTRFDKLFTGVMFKRPASLVGDIAGCENISPDETFDADYGAMLERVYGKGVASPTGVVPEWSREIPGEVPAVGGEKAA